MKGKVFSQSIDELEFSQVDMQIFRIQDRRTRVNTLQNYFFPRLEVLLRHALGIVRELFSLDPFRTYRFAYHPNPREGTEAPEHCSSAMMGISGRFQSDRFLRFEGKNGGYLRSHPSALYFAIESEGYIQAQLLPLRYLTKPRTVSRISVILRQHASLINRFLLANQISYSSAIEADSLADALMNWETDPRGFYLFSPRFYFPSTPARGLIEVTQAFVALYPLFEALIHFGEGTKQTLAPSVEKTIDWLSEFSDEEPINAALADVPEAQLPELESYRFVRAGLWWDVLARDEWTCQSCGRKPQDGVTLQVDHIVPRSKGGADLLVNLQTLCKKCNIGKSNRDSTDLRR
ncbi:MAG: hypothetical protein NVSMB9_17860 [Isosphaeraceae bacterium]